MDIIGQYFSAQHFWAIAFAIMVSWSITEVVKRVERAIRMNDMNNLLPIVVSYTVAATVIFYRWPGDFYEDLMMAVIFGSSAPLLHKFSITLIGKKWPWLRTSITGERKCYKEDEFTGEDMTIWLSPEEATKQKDELVKLNNRKKRGD